jgi:hypothetical protein
LVHLDLHGHVRHVHRRSDAFLLPVDVVDLTLRGERVFYLTMGEILFSTLFKTRSAVVNWSCLLVLRFSSERCSTIYKHRIYRVSSTCARRFAPCLR